MNMIPNFKILLLLFAVVITSAFERRSYSSIPIYFPEFGVTILEPKVGDTLYYKKSTKENFKFLFFDKKGKCYCEKYLNNRIYERGYYENSLDTLKRYVSGRTSENQMSSIKVERFFQPLRNGQWFVYSSGKKRKQIYDMGLLK